MSDETTRFFAERGFGIRIGFGERPAVVVVDMIRGFTDPTLPLGSDLASEIAATRRLLDEARGAELPILFTTVSYSDPDFADAGVWGLKQRGIRSLAAGTPSVELDDRLGRLPAEPIIPKKQASGFFATDLIARLTVLRIDTLIVAGCTTSGCVRATVVDACAYGFRTAVVREAVGDRALAAHRQSLFDLEQKYADVVGLDEALAYIVRLAGSAGVRAAPQSGSRTSL